MKHKPSSAASARTALVLNQFATPGLGSLMAGRYVAGAFQLIFAIVGFVLILLWFFMVLKAAYDIMETTGEPHPPHYLGWIGLGCFVFAWGWAWVTSISLVRQAQKSDRERLDAGMPPSSGQPGAHS